MSTSKSDILFYSNHCAFSNKVISLCLAKKMKQHFLFVCVDTNMHKLPDFVDRVPMIYRKYHSDILYDDDIIAYIQAMAPLVGGDVQQQQQQNTHNSQQQGRQQSLPPQMFQDKGQEQNQGNGQSDDGILPFSIQQNVNYSDQFSFLEEENAGDGMTPRRGFTLLNEDVRLPRFTGEEDENTSNKLKLDTQMIDSYMQMRDQDTASFKQKMNNGLQPLVR